MKTSYLTMAGLILEKDKEYIPTTDGFLSLINDALSFDETDQRMNYIKENAWWNKHKGSEEVLIDSSTDESLMLDIVSNINSKMNVGDILEEQTRFGPEWFVKVNDNKYLTDFYLIRLFQFCTYGYYDGGYLVNTDEMIKILNYDIVRKSLDKLSVRGFKNLSESYLAEADSDFDDEEDFDDDSGDFGTEDFDDFDSDIEDDEDFDDEDFSTDDDLEDDSEEESEPKINDMRNKKISFPILIEGFDEDNQPISMDFEDEQEYAQEYGDLVIDTIEQNKKFIMTALDVYNIEFYYESYDKNSNVTFTATSNKDVDSQKLMNVLKRYFNVNVDNKVTDEGEFTLSPILDNKFIKVI